MQDINTIENFKYLKFRKMKMRKTDIVNNKRIKRQECISITFRYFINS